MMVTVSDDDDNNHDDDDERCLVDLQVELGFGEFVLSACYGDHVLR
jgi:hypothetical protein